MNALVTILFLMTILPSLAVVPEVRNYLVDRTTEDARIADLAEKICSDISKIEMQNHELRAMTASCPAALADPEIAAELKVAGEAIALLQDTTIIALRANLADLNTVHYITAFAEPQRAPSGICGIPGSLNWTQHQLLTAIHRFSGFQITKNSDSIFWSFHHPNLGDIE